MSSDTQLIDLLKKKLGFATDTELAGYLGITRSTIYQIRAGSAKLGALQRFKVLDHLQYLRITDWLQKLSPEYLAATIERKVRDRAQSLALRKTEKGPPSEADGALLYWLAVFTGSATDEDLSKYLGLKRNSLSMVRKGKAKLGLFPRLRILKLLNPELELEEFESALESSEALLEIVKRDFPELFKRL